MAASTLTNTGATTETKTLNITPEMWDGETGTLLVRFQPKYQRCVGMSLAIESSFPIESISLSYTPDTVQIAKENI